MDRFWGAVVYKANDKIVAERTDNGKTYTIPKGKYLVRTTDGRWRVTNAVPAIWLELTSKQEILAEPTGDNTNDERDWWDTN